ncbi:MAG: hypothetical protein AB7O28_18200 [Vicinamibacterales bacterium]
MPSEPRAADPLEHARLVERVAGAVARVKGLGADDTNAFVRMVSLRMAAPAGGRPAPFESAPQRQAYLTIVVARLLRDWQSSGRGRGAATRTTPS